MTAKNSFGYLKKRILDVLDEYYTAENTVFVADGNRDILEKRIPDAVYSSLVRMYESVSAEGNCKTVLEMYNGALPEGISLPDNCEVFSLPQDFERFIYVEAGGKKLGLSRIYFKDGFAFINKNELSGEKKVFAEYKKLAPIIDENTADTFVFDLSQIAFEALICLSASEICREENANVYTRLLYKYNDLYEGMCAMALPDNGRNTFYKDSKRRRW